MSGPKPCVFCGSIENKKSREHVFPRWLEKHVPSHVTRSFRKLEIDDWGETRRSTETERDMPIGTYQHTTGGICKQCNESWMNNLETDVRPLLVPMVEGMELDLDSPACRALAAWSWKTAAMVQRLADSKNQAVQKAQYQDFYAEHVPPDGATVWIAQYEAGDRPELAESYYVWTGLVLTKPPDSSVRPPRNVYTIGFAVGPVAILVFGSHDVDLSLLVAAGLPEPKMTQIWPMPAEPLRWPPEGVLVGDDLRNAIVSFAAVLNAVKQ